MRSYCYYQVSCSSSPLRKPPEDKIDLVRKILRKIILLNDGFRVIINEELKTMAQQATSFNLTVLLIRAVTFHYFLGKSNKCLRLMNSRQRK